MSNSISFPCRLGEESRYSSDVCTEDLLCNIRKDRRGEGGYRAKICHFPCNHTHPQTGLSTHMCIRTHAAFQSTCYGQRPCQIPGVQSSGSSPCSGGVGTSPLSPRRIVESRKRDVGRTVGDSKPGIQGEFHGGGDIQVQSSGKVSIHQV